MDAALFDFKASRGANDKTLVEFKLAGNPQLRRNLEKTTRDLSEDSDTKAGFKVIIYFMPKNWSGLKNFWRNSIPLVMIMCTLLMPERTINHPDQKHKRFNKNFQRTA